MEKNESNLKNFFIKLASIVIALIILINVTYNLILADKIESINNILLLNKSENRVQLKDKIRNEIKRGLAKDQILNEDDKILFYNLYIKLKKEFQNIDS
tara:strand:+ start:788 stop:1084 length:297 start_codon:yes stop_codon:yes gene_type:complete